MLLIDSNVLIDFLRGKPEAIEFLFNLTDRLVISAISVSELYAGVREGRERKSLETLIERSDVVAVTEEIAIQGGLFQREYLRSHGTGLADAIIAATAESRNLKLATLNRKHFPMFSNILVPY